jgi:hypothetical protein
MGLEPEKHHLALLRGYAASEGQAERAENAKKAGGWSL